MDSCRTGVEAIAQAAASSYDLVVLDWMLPEYDGLAVCRERRRVTPAGWWRNRAARLRPAAPAGTCSHQLPPVWDGHRYLQPPAPAG